MKNRGISIFVYSILLTTLSVIGNTYEMYGQTDEPGDAVLIDPTAGCQPITVDPGVLTPSVNPGGPGCANNPSWTGVQQADAWFLINVPATGVLFLNPAGTVDAGMAAYTYNAATNTYTLLDCDDDTGPGLMPQITVNQPAGTPIYVQLWAYGGGTISFNMCSAECATPLTYSPDEDGDGYGETGTTQTTCNPPAGWVTNDDDCNDQCGTVYTGMPCNDNNPATAGDVISGANCMCEGTVITTNDCIPGGAESFTFTPAGALAAPVIGTNVQICYEIDWLSNNGLWMDGMQFQLGPGWTAITQDVLPANCNGGQGVWVYETNGSPTSGCSGAMPDNSATNNTVGYYFDYSSSGDPFSNWGDAGSCTFTGCITATINSVNATDLGINVFSGGDNIFGSFGGVFACDGCIPVGFSYPAPNVGADPCGINLPVCVTPSLCDENTGLITIDQTNQNFVSFSNPPTTGNLVIVVNGDAINPVQTIPAPFVGSPIPLSFTMYANGSATNAVTAYFTDDPGCTATSNLVSPAACGCRVEVDAVNLTCSPINPDGYIVEFDLNNVNAIPNGSHVEINFDGSPGNDWESLPVSGQPDIDLINALPATFGTLTPLSTLVPAMSDGIGNYTVSVQDAAGVVNTNCTIVTPVPSVINLPLVELTSPLVTNCTSTAQGSVFDVSFDANLSGFDLMSGNNILTFYNNGVPIDAIINSPPAPPYPAASNFIDLTTLTNGAADIVSIMFPAVPHNVLNSLSFTIENASGCVFNALVNDPSVNEFQFTLTNTPGDPYEAVPCACAITNLQLQNATPECVGYGNYLELGMAFSFENIPQGVPFVAYFTDVANLTDLDMTTTPLPTPPAGFNVQDLFSYADFSSNPILCPSGACAPIQTGTFPQQASMTPATMWQTSISQLPVPPPTFEVTEDHPGFLVVEFQYPTGTLQCSASVPFTIPGFCGCSLNVPAGNDDGSPFVNLATPASNANDIAICPNEPALEFGFTPAGPLSGFRPPAIAHFENLTTLEPEAYPYAPALALVLIDPNDPDKQILWDYEMIDLTGPTPSIANPLTIDNPYAIGGGYANQDLIHNLFNVNPLPDPEDLTAPLEVQARVITVYNMDELLLANPTVPFLIPATHIDNANVALPYSGDIFKTGYDNFTNPDVIRCGAKSDDYTLVFTPIIHVENIQWDCDARTIAFEMHSGSYAFDWSLPTLNSSPGPVPDALSNPNPFANTNPGNTFTYDLTGMANGYVLDVTLTDNFGCNQVQYPTLDPNWNPIIPSNFVLDNHVVFNPYVAPTVGQVFIDDVGGSSPLVLNTPNQNVRCGRTPNAEDFNLIGGGVGVTGSLNGTWNIGTQLPSPTYQLPSPVNAYYSPDPNNPDALIFNTALVSSDQVINANDVMTSPFVTPPYSLYFTVEFTPVITDPNGCAYPSPVYEIAFLDNFTPQAILTPGGVTQIEKCLNEPQFDLAAIGGLPSGGIWHVGPMDPTTNTGASDNLIENGSTFDLSNLPNTGAAGTYQAFYDVSGVVGVQCPVISVDNINIIIHDTTNADVTPDILEDCMPLGKFVLTNSSLSIDTSTPCEWYVDDVLQPEDACDTVGLMLMMPKMYDITLVSTDLNGCVDTTRYEDLLEVHPQPEMAFLYNPQSVTMDNPEFQFIDDSDSPLVSYEWNFAGYGTSAEPYTKFNFSEVTEPGSYDVILTGWDANQCSTVVTRQVLIEEGFVVFMPSSFTPDDDNLNEALRPVISGADRIKFYKFMVFDRWGNVVFETDDYKQWWTGDSKVLPGYYVPNGAYQWRMEVILEGLEDRKIYKGSVTIMR